MWWFFKKVDFDLNYISELHVCVVELHDIVLKKYDSLTTGI